MREIQVVNNAGDIWISISNLGEIIVDGWPYDPNPITHNKRDCAKLKSHECFLGFDEYMFDAQIFRYSVHILQHNYLDPALREGEKGVHIDVYPEVYPKNSFPVNEYAGLYFDNPLPEELNYCPTGSTRRR